MTPLSSDHESGFSETFTIGGPFSMQVSFRSCLECGATVPVLAVVKHRDWHASLRR